MIGLAGKAVRFDNEHLHVELVDGRIISTPLHWYPELEQATIKKLNKYSFICDATGIEWDELDYHLSIEAMLRIAIQKAA